MSGLLAQAAFPDWAWIARNGDYIRDKLVEHVVLTALPVAIGLLIAAPLAILALRRPRLHGPLLTATGVLFTIPSLVLFVLLLGVTGLTLTTAVIGLTLYTLLILFRNTAEGLRGVPVEVREAAEAMGHTPRQLLWRVQVPVALPVIVGGIRLATVTTVGLVTITALIGFGGVGHLFILGFQRQNRTILLTGLVLSIALAAVADVALLALERRFMPWRRQRRPARPAG